MPSDEFIKRETPNSYDAEQSVVGAMLLDKEAIRVASELLKTEDFYHSSFRIIYETIKELDKEGRAIDPVILQDRLKEKNVPPSISSAEYIGEIISKVPTSANVKHYAQIVAEKATLRKLIKVGEGIVNDCHTKADDMEKLLTSAERSVFEITQKRNPGEYVPIDKGVMKTLDQIELSCKTHGSVTGHSTGFKDLDYMTSGFQPADLIIVAARPSMGKTAFVLNIAEHMALHDNKCVAIFSLEMPMESLIKRILAMNGHVDAQNIRNGVLSDLEWQNLIESANIIGNSNLIIDDTSSITVQTIASKCRNYKREKDLQVIMIDYMQLIRPSDGTENRSRNEQVGEISRSLKALARELNVPVVALSQLSRDTVKRTDQRPMLSDLRDSGSIEQDADMVMFIHREEYFNHDSEKNGISEIIIAKQRNGPIGTVNLLWLPQYTKFVNLEKD